MRNECSRPIALMFMTFGDQQVVTAELPPGGRFVSDGRMGPVRRLHVHRLPGRLQAERGLPVENKDAIGLSLYNCVGGKPNFLASGSSRGVPCGRPGLGPCG